jgi:hypothetical protein
MLTKLSSVDLPHNPINMGDQRKLLNWDEEVYFSIFGFVYIVKNVACSVCQFLCLLTFYKRKQTNVNKGEHSWTLPPRLEVAHFAVSRQWVFLRLEL